LAITRSFVTGEKKKDKQEIELLARERLGIVDLHKSIFIENNEIRQ